MRCIDPVVAATLHGPRPPAGRTLPAAAVAAALTALLAACGAPTLQPPAPAAPPMPSSPSAPPSTPPSTPGQATNTAPPGAPPMAPTSPAGPATAPGSALPGGQRPGSGTPAPESARTPPAAGAGATRPAPRAPQRHPPLGPPTASRSWDEFRLQAARRLVAAHPDGSYTGQVPEPLLAIPVLEVELNGDGSVRRVHVLRHPRQAIDTTQLAIDAVHRAAPYGDVSRLPRPWKWAEVFLFDDERRFKPRTLDR